MRASGIADVLVCPVRVCRSFGCLEQSTYHPWVKAIFNMSRVGTIFQSCAHYPVLMNALLWLAPKSAMEERENHINMSKDKLRRRMESGKERHDLIEGLLLKADEWVCFFPPPPPPLSSSV